MQFYQQTLPHLMSQIKLAAALSLILVFPSSGIADTPTSQASPSLQPSQNYSTAEIISESLTGDVYSDPSKWQNLSLGDLFSSGWNKPWASPPTGGGGAPRQGWLNADDGVFYRLGLGIFGYNNQINSGLNSYSGTISVYTPLNQRFEFRTDIPVATATANQNQTNFGDFQITPRMILSETKNTTQTFDLTFRAPTGNSINGNGVAAISPTYNFWNNSWKGLVLRGGLGFTVPYSGYISATGSRSTFNANLAAGYYITPHDNSTFSDTVLYVAANLMQDIDNRGPSSTTTLALAPGIRTFLGENWYFLGSVSVPVTTPEAYNYQVLGALMKVW
jgi:hypothetical protein